MPSAKTSISQNGRKKRKVMRFASVVSHHPITRTKRIASASWLIYIIPSKLPVHPPEVQRQIRLLGLPPSGASSLQQFSFYLLSFLCAELPFPPWTPIPIVTIVPPTTTALCEQALAVSKARVPEGAPYAYRVEEGKLATLWVWRRQMWDKILTSLATPNSSSLCQFLLTIYNEYVNKVMNMVETRIDREVYLGTSTI